MTDAWRRVDYSHESPVSNATAYAPAERRALSFARYVEEVQVQADGRGAAL
jgi:hypothetical protein